MVETIVRPFGYVKATLRGRRLTTCPAGESPATARW
jgi:hypothetical protein